MIQHRDSANFSFSFCSLFLIVASCPFLQTFFFMWHILSVEHLPVHSNAMYSVSLAWKFLLGSQLVNEVLSTCKDSFITASSSLHLCKTAQQSRSCYHNAVE